jgi:hypothetical protein
MPYRTMVIVLLGVTLGLLTILLLPLAIRDVPLRLVAAPRRVVARGRRPLPHREAAGGTDPARRMGARRGVVA